MICQALRRREVSPRHMRASDMHDEHGIDIAFESKPYSPQLRYAASTVKRCNTARYITTLNILSFTSEMISSRITSWPANVAPYTSARRVRSAFYSPPSQFASQR